MVGVMEDWEDGLSKTSGDTGVGSNENEDLLQGIAVVLVAVVVYVESPLKKIENTFELWLKLHVHVHYFT